jgi:phosphoribosylaminoimidazolecarboxamide formyltransferase/IMP cyclohydrolase
MSKHRVLVSVTDKTGIAELCEKLILLGYEIVSTGGTATILRNSGLDVTEVAEITNMPEMLEGRVKT